VYNYDAAFRFLCLKHIFVVLLKHATLFLKLMKVVVIVVVIIIIYASYTLWLFTLVFLVFLCINAYFLDKFEPYNRNM
jgi:hypothetical protein